MSVNTNFKNPHIRNTIGFINIYPDHVCLDRFERMYPAVVIIVVNLQESFPLAFDFRLNVISFYDCW